MVRLGSFGVQRRLRVSFQQSRSVSSTLFDEDARNPTETNTEEWRSELPLMAFAEEHLGVLVQVRV